MTLRDVQKEQTRQRLLDAALQCFEAQGLAATTIEDIVGAAGATRPTFYRHFESKAALVAALTSGLLAGVTELNARLRPAVATGTRKALSAWLTEAFGFWEHRRAVSTAQVEAAAIDPGTATRRERSFAEGVDAIVGGLTDAGRFDEPGRRTRAVLMYAQLQNVFHRFMETGWEVDRAEALSVMTAMWLAALKA